MGTRMIRKWPITRFSLAYSAAEHYEVDIGLFRYAVLSAIFKRPHLLYIHLTSICFSISRVVNVSDILNQHRSHALCIAATNACMFRSDHPRRRLPKYWPHCYKKQLIGVNSIESDAKIATPEIKYFVTKLESETLLTRQHMSFHCFPRLL